MEFQRRELGRLLRTVRYRLGIALRGLIRRPWRVTAFIEALREVKAQGRAGLPAERDARPPYPSLTSGGTEDEAAYRLGLQAELHRLTAESREVEGSPAYRLGTLIVSPAKPPWRLPLLPVLFLFELLRPARAEAPTGPVGGSLQPPVEKAERVALRSRREALVCLAPAWMEEMLSFEDVVPLNRGEGGPSGVLVCLQDHDPDHVARVATTLGELPPDPPVALWFFDHEAPPPPQDVLSRASRLYAGSVQGASQLSGKLDRPVEPLLPAVQPLLHNPIGWWNGEEGTQGRHEGAGRLPAAWETLISLARAQPIDPVLGAQSGFMTADMPPPTWLPATWATDWQRFDRMRSVLRYARIADRVEAVRAGLGFDLPQPRGELVSVIVSTNRPDNVPSIIESFGRQSHRPIELALVLHGPGFDHASVRDELEARGFRYRLLAAPDSFMLGECLQLACDESSGALVCKMDDDDWYGPDYVADAALAMEFSEAGIAGKDTFVIDLREEKRLYLSGPGREFSYRYTSGGSRLVIRRGVLEQVRWRPLTVGEDGAFVTDCKRQGIPMLSTDRFHYVCVRGNPANHTWPISSDELHATRMLVPLSGGAPLEGL